ncbi:MAG: hypothetical protein DRQ37_08670, partial [Gammaproteobacteria bacterium]
GQMDLRVVAEGVERSEQVDLLRAQGCSRMQGFYFARPMPPEGATAFLQSPVLAMELTASGAVVPDSAVDAPGDAQVSAPD